MKKFFALFLLLFTGLFAGCDMCAGPTQLTFYSPWGRTNVSETSVYRITAEAPADEDLNNNYTLNLYAVGSGTYTTSLGQNEDGTLTVTNVYEFTGKFFDKQRNVLKRKNAPEGDDGTVTDRYTATATFSVISDGKELFRAVKSSRTYDAMTVVATTAEGTVLKRAAFTQTIEYHADNAVATFENRAVEGWTEEDYFEMTFGRENDETLYSRTYRYGANDLIIDNELYLYALRSLSANTTFSSGSITPSSFATVNPMNDIDRPNTSAAGVKYAVATTIDTNLTFEQNIFADDPDSTFTTKEVRDGNAYKVTTTMNSGNTGLPIEYIIFRDSGEEENMKETKVRYKQSGGGDTPPISLCRVLAFDYSLNFSYRLTRYENTSPKTPA